MMRTYLDYTVELRFATNSELRPPPNKDHFPAVPIKLHPRCLVSSQIRPTRN